MFCYMAKQRAERDAEGNWLHRPGAVFHKRGEVEPPPAGDPVGFQRRMAADGYEVRYSNEDLGDVVDAENNTVHKRVVRRPNRPLEIEE